MHIGTTWTDRILFHCQHWNELYGSGQLYNAVKNFANADFLEIFRNEINRKQYQTLKYISFEQKSIDINDLDNIALSGKFQITLGKIFKARYL